MPNLQSNIQTRKKLKKEKTIVSLRCVTQAVRFYVTKTFRINSMLSYENILQKVGGIRYFGTMAVIKMALWLGYAK